MPVAEDVEGQDDGGVGVAFFDAEAMQGFVAVDELSSLTLTEDDQEQQAPAPLKPIKPIVGIIFPPPEVRNIVDKTASFVARNGPDFEIRIKQNEQNNAKFNFLSTGDPYHAYYRNKVKEIQEGKVSVTPQGGSAAAAEGFKSSQQLIDDAKKKKQAELLKQVELPFVPKEPPAEFDFIADPPSISAHELEVVKLTAQFVARNGRQFLSTLMTREQRSYQFDFLRPQHSLFQYFTKLLEQYTKVLIPPKDYIKTLEKENPAQLLEDVKYRANWIKHQEIQKRKVEEEAEKERLAYSSIDWHDFVVVETVDYQPFEQGSFPPPTTPQEVGARVLLQDRILQGTEKDAVEGSYQATTVDDTQVQDMEEDSDSSDDEGGQESKKPPLPPPAEPEQPQRPALPIPEPPREDQVIIKKGYDPKMSKHGATEKILRPGPKPEEYTISPITGERIPVSKLQEHMRIGLLDPKWKDQRDRQLMEKVNQESVFAAGFAVEESLKQFADRRSDIFGVGVEETTIGKKVGEEERIPGQPWDPTAGLSSTLLSNLEESKAEEPKEQIGPVITHAPPQPNPPPPPGPPMNQGILQPPGVAPPGTGPPPQLPGMIRPMGLPPQGMMMQNLQRVGPLLGPPGGFNYPPSGPPMPRPPLLPQAPPPQMLIPPIPGTIKPTGPPPPLLKPPPPPSVDDEPSAKKMKSLEDALIPEAQFLAMNRSPTTFTVVCPSIPDKPEMNLSGQIISVTMGLSEPISLIKTKVQELIGLQPGKQKLSTEGIFLKDNNSLAYYNIGDRATLQLSVKERGGRKK